MGQYDLSLVFFIFLTMGIIFATITGIIYSNYSNELKELKKQIKKAKHKAKKLKN